MANLVSFLCAAVPAVVLSVLGVPLPITVVVMVVCGVGGLLVANSKGADERRETERVQKAAVTLADWAHRNGGHSETDPEALPADGWELPESHWFHGAVLALGRVDGFEVAVTCFLEASTEGATTRHTGYLVRLPEVAPPETAPDTAPELRLNRTELRRIRRGSGRELPADVRERLAAVPADTESVDAVDGVLYLVRPRWPEFSAPDEQVAATVGVAAALTRSRGSSVDDSVDG
ncbi:MAG: hypothetical protein ACRDSK_22500 [Actinophytocola sp.]|uniref:hypothetical protein n=1 Tax=Actinophytocola sp. TaxID=1872138 RepID=UPI003D6AF30D